MYTNKCAGCKNEFQTKNIKQTRCKRNCSRKATELDLKRRTVAREKVQDAHELEFIGVDGEGIWGPYEVVQRRDDDGDLLLDEDGDPIEHAIRSQNYVLLSVGAESKWFPDERPLTHDDVFGFLWEQFQAHPKAVFVGFSLGYDFNFWLKSVTATSAWKLLTPDGKKSRTPKPESPRHGLYPVRDGGNVLVVDEDEGEVYRHYITPKWEFEMLGSKRFSLRPYVKWGEEPTHIVHHKDGTVTEEKDPRPWMHICDTFPYFQQSFMGVLNPKKTAKQFRAWEDADYEIIKRGKEDRTAAEHITPEMIEYNITENKVLAAVMAQMNESLVAEGIRLSRSQWYGPGQAAQAWMGNKGFPTSEDVQAVTPQTVLDAAHDSYYGGWFELFAHGHVPGLSYEYDINSAYPSVIATLPCLLHGRWRTSRKLPPPIHGDNRLHLVHVDLEGSNKWVGPAPHRDSRGSILRPMLTRGWHWLHELQAAERAGLIKKMRIRRVLTYEPCACPSPGEPIRQLYEGRVMHGEEFKDSPRGKAMKLIYNSVYGKCAQSIGKPKYANPIYASLITAGCREKILDAIATHPTGYDSLLMIATDGIYFREPHPNLDIDGLKLGAWGMKTKTDLTLFLPGIYWDKSARDKVAAGEDPSMKSRGVSSKYMKEMIPDVDEQWDALRGWLGEDPPWPTYRIDIEFAQISAKQAITRKRWDLCARVLGGQAGLPEHRDLNATPVAKRKSDGVYLRDDLLRTSIHVQADCYETTYYPKDRTFGMRLVPPDEDMSWFKGPELIDTMDTPDGPVGLGLMEEFE